MGKHKKMHMLLISPCGGSSFRPSCGCRAFIFHKDSLPVWIDVNAVNRWQRVNFNVCRNCWMQKSKVCMYSGDERGPLEVPVLFRVPCVSLDIFLESRRSFARKKKRKKVGQAESAADLWPLVVGTWNEAAVFDLEWECGQSQPEAP